MSEWRLHWVEASVVPVDVLAPDAPSDDAKIRARARISKGTLADLISGKATYCRIRIDLPPESLVRGVRLLTVPSSLGGFYPMADTLRVSGPPPRDAPKREGSMVFYMAARSLLGLQQWRGGAFITREKWERTTFLVPPKASPQQAELVRAWIRAVRDERVLLPNPWWRFGGSVIGGRKMTLNGFGEPDGVYLEYNGVECLELGVAVAAGLFVPRDAFAKVSYWARPWFERPVAAEIRATITRRAAEQIRMGELVGWGADGMRVIRR